MKPLTPGQTVELTINGIPFKGTIQSVHVTGDLIAFIGDEPIGSPEVFYGYTILTDFDKQED